MFYGLYGSTGRNNKNPQTETLRKHVTPSRKHDGLDMFTLTDTSRLLMFPSLRLQRNRTTFLHVSVGFPLKETSVCKRNFLIALAETRKNGPETSFFYVSVNVFGLSDMRKDEFTHRKRVIQDDGNKCFRKRNFMIALAEIRENVPETSCFRLRIRTW